jgi:hypothetical protein
VEVLYHKLVQWNTAVVEHGELCVITVGTTKMLLWFVDSWDSQPQVYICSYVLRTACTKIYANSARFNVDRQACDRNSIELIKA